MNCIESWQKKEGLFNNNEQKKKLNLFLFISITRAKYYKSIHNKKKSQLSITSKFVVRCLLYNTKTTSCLRTIK